MNIQFLDLPRERARSIWREASRNMEPAVLGAQHLGRRRVIRIARSRLY